VNGIVSYATYLPRARLRRDAVAAALGTAGGRGTRAVAAYDEDSTSMGVEAARLALRAGPPGFEPGRVLFATTSPGYLDKTNATALHAALALGRHTGAYDMVGSVRSAIGAFHAGASAADGALVVLGDVRTGLPGGSDELNGGDGAAAFLFGDGEGDGDVVAEILASGATSEEFLDRWRVPGQPASGRWEERFGETAYVPLAEEAVTDALKRAGVDAADVDHLIVAGVHPRAARRVAKTVGARPEALVDDLAESIGNTGAAHPGLLLAAALDRAEAGQVLLLVVLADGADAVVLRATEHLAAFRTRAGSTVAEQVVAGDDSLGYATFLTWRGLLHREPPRRPDPVPPAGPPALRREAWKFAFTASRCEACGTRHLPPARVCVRCEAIDQMTDERLADVRGTIATYTVDRLAYSLNPPVVVAVIDFDGGGRYQCEMTDVDPASVRIGDRVEMTFRRLFTAGGVHNYFWKARPLRAAGEER
jgi:3-hydroxy-3-methylglutaryl CoA synthase/uncharacterized OB-fold protein